MNWKKEKIAALIVLAVLLLCKVIVTIFYEEPEIKPYSNVRPARRIVIEGISFTTTFPDRSYYDEAKQTISVSVENEPSKDTRYRLLDAKFCEGKVIAKRRNDRRDLYEYDIYETDGTYIVSYVVDDGGGAGASNAWFKDGTFYYYYLNYADERTVLCRAGAYRHFIPIHYENGVRSKICDGRLQDDGKHSNWNSQDH